MDIYRNKNQSIFTFPHLLEIICLFHSRHGIPVALLPLPVHRVASRDSGEREVMHGGRRDPKRKTAARERVLLPRPLSRLGGRHRGRAGDPRHRLPQPEDAAVLVHLYHPRVLPSAGEAVYRVSAGSAHAGLPPAALLAQQVSPWFANPSATIMAPPNQFTRKHIPLMKS